MRKILIIGLLIITTLVITMYNPKTTMAFCVNNPSSTSANCSSNNGQICTGSAANSSYCKDTASGQNTVTGPNGFIIKAVNILAFAAGIAAVIVIIIGSIRLIISSGDSKAINDARNMIIYALVGLVAIAIADLIVRFLTGVI